MTILAQLNDCHCCNDARSLVQKKNKLTYNQTGGYDHSVLDTFVQLTEGRSARDQPKQPPAKKYIFLVAEITFSVRFMSTFSQSSCLAERCKLFNVC